MAWINYGKAGEVGVIDKTLCERAIAEGLDPSTPAVAVARATRSDEHTITDTIANLPGRIAAERPGTPLLVLIGRVLEGDAARSLLGTEGNPSSTSATKEGGTVG